MDVREQIERIEPAEGGSTHRRAALISAIFAAALAVLEIGSHAAQSQSHAFGQQANDTWSFYQNRLIRTTILQSLTETVEAIVPGERTDAAKQLVADWRKRVARYQSDPVGKEGLRELLESGRLAEKGRDHAIERQHVFKLASTITQIAIIVVSASIIVSANWLTWLGASFGGLGLIIGFLAWLDSSWVVGRI